MQIIQFHQFIPGNKSYDRAFITQNYIFAFDIQGNTVIFIIIDVKSQSVLQKTKLHLNSQNFSLQCFEYTQTCNYLIVSFGHKHLDQGQIFVFQFNGKKLIHQFSNQFNKNVTAAQFCVHNNLILGTITGEIYTSRVNYKKQQMEFHLLRQLQASMSLNFINIQPNKIQKIIVDEFDTQNFHLIMINIVCGITIHIFLQQAYDIEDITLNQETEYLVSENLNWCKSQSQLPELLLVQKNKNKIYYLVQQLEGSEISLSYIEFDEQTITKTYLVEIIKYITKTMNVQVVDQNMIQQTQLDQINIIQGIKTIQNINLAIQQKINQIQGFSVSEYHTFIQSDNILYINNVINGQLIQKYDNQDTPKTQFQYSTQDVQNQNPAFQYDNFMMIFLTKNLAISTYEILNENTDLYKTFMEVNKFDEALKFCKSEKEKNLVLHKKYEFLIQSEKYNEAGTLLSQIESDINKVIVNLQEQRLLDVLINFLYQKLLLGQEKQKLIFHFLIQSLSELINQCEYQMKIHINQNSEKINNLYLSVKKQILTEKALNLKLQNKKNFYKNFQFDLIENNFNEKWFDKNEILEIGIQNQNKYLIETLILMFQNENEIFLYKISQKFHQNSFFEAEKMILQKFTDNQILQYIQLIQEINDTYIQLLSQRLTDKINIQEFQQIIIKSSENQLKIISSSLFTNEKLVKQLNYHIVIKLFQYNQSEQNLTLIWNNFKQNPTQQNQIQQFALKNKFYNLLQEIFLYKKNYNQFIHFTLLQVKNQTNIYYFLTYTIQKIGFQYIELILQQGCKQIKYEIQDALKILEFVFQNRNFYKNLSQILFILIENLQDYDQILLISKYQFLFKKLVETQRQQNQENQIILSKKQQKFQFVYNKKCSKCGNVIQTQNFHMFSCGHIYCDNCSQNKCLKCSDEVINELFDGIEF